MLDAWKVPRHIGESKMVLHRLHTAQDSMRPIRCVRALVSMRVIVGEEKEGGGGGAKREYTEHAYCERRGQSCICIVAMQLHARALSTQRGTERMETVTCPSRR